MKPKRLQPEDRRREILNAAITLAKREGYNRITRDAIAEHAGVSMGLVTRYFNTMNQLRRDLMRHAVASEDLPIIAQGLAARDPHAQKATPELQRRALDSVLNA